MADLESGHRVIEDRDPSVVDCLERTRSAVLNVLVVVGAGIAASGWRLMSGQWWNDGSVAVGWAPPTIRKALPGWKIGWWAEPTLQGWKRRDHLLPDMSLRIELPRRQEPPRKEEEDEDKPSRILSSPLATPGVLAVRFFVFPAFHRTPAC